MTGFSGLLSVFFVTLAATAEFEHDLRVRKVPFYVPFERIHSCSPGTMKWTVDGGATQHFTPGDSMFFTEGTTEVLDISEDFMDIVSSPRTEKFRTDPSMQSNPFLAPAAQVDFRRRPTGFRRAGC
ncbi:hypothetical protein StoSoilB3_43060 (plasmid) [Arthrobacter sp. StoSoilB3]|nr:hypothetical protein StoSoilB3_43060 [Arthrobacter sp. StoSoilB3]